MKKFIISVVCFVFVGVAALREIRSYEETEEKLRKTLEAGRTAIGKQDAFFKELVEMEQNYF